MPGRFDVSRWLVLRGLGVVFLCAFWSLGIQLSGLIGPEGILPAGGFLERARSQLGSDVYWRLPTVCWLIGTSDAALRGIAIAGGVAAVALTVNVVPRVAAIVAWGAYLSLVSVGQLFLHFQWDTLLLEAGLLAIIAAPGGVRPGYGRYASSRIAMALFLLLAFKLNLLSGMAKLQSGDPTWRDLTALQFHYWTTCLPTWTGWWADKLPAGFHATTTAAVLIGELVVPFALFAGRRARHVAAMVLIALQVGIAATGNYGFFNLLSTVVCFACFDDQALGRVRSWLRSGPPRPPAPRLQRVTVETAALFVAVLSLVTIGTRTMGRDWVPEAVERVQSHIAPFRSINGYGLFASMTTTRPEIVFEAMGPAGAWHEYELPWKPGTLDRRPGFTGPHMPRLDWQLWFAALQGPQRAWWVGSVLERLLDRSPAVTGLFSRTPLGSQPPRAVRAVLYAYRFTTDAERTATGHWWNRRRIGIYAVRDG